MSSYPSYPGANQADLASAYRKSTRLNRRFKFLLTTFDSRKQCLTTKGLSKPIESAQLSQNLEQRQEADQRFVILVVAIRKRYADGLKMASLPNVEGRSQTASPL